MNPTTTLYKDKLAQAVDARRAQFASDLKQIVEVPSVSAQAKHKADMRRCAEVAQALIERAGGKGEMVETKGNPIVVGTFELAQGAPWIAIYNHIDVQPAEEGKDGWTRAPFTCVEEDGRWYGRGSTDDKGPAIAALHAVQLAREEGIAINVRLLWELEEEFGSPSYEGFLQLHGQRLKPDSVLVSDTIWLAEGKPAKVPLWRPIAPSEKITRSRGPSSTGKTLPRNAW